MRIAIYTAIFGDKDQLREGLVDTSEKNVDYFIISDNQDLEPKYYKLIYKPLVYNNIAKNARYYKIIGLEIFKEYDYVIWHDANLEIITKKVGDLIAGLNFSSIATFRHPVRNNIYDEGIECILSNKDSPVIILHQLLRYKISRYPFKHQLFETSVLVRDVRKENKLKKIWWKEVKSYSRRDQISLPYALHCTGVGIGLLVGDREVNPYTKFYPHVHYNYYFKDNSLELRSPDLLKWSCVKIIKLLKII